jgi:hypothetical protein
MTNDGTQDPVPPPVLSDPLSGLVTGGRYEPEPLRVRVTEPPLPDIAAVREAMAHVLDENSELDLGSIIPASEFFTDSTGETAPGRPVPPVAQVPVKDVPAQAPGQAAPSPAVTGPVPTRGAVKRVTPAIPAPRSRPGGTARALPPVTAAGERTRRIRLPRGLVRDKPKLPPTKVKGTSSVWSVTLIVVLLIVMGVLGIVFLASFIDTVAAVFD